MGLSGPKKRTKISSDPNNLAWANSTSTFGHKILISKGWKPGDYLGTKDAAHADHYTAANASSIRVVLREDNLGLGARVGKGNVDTFGLSMFSGLLGRLNGKSDTELQAQQSAQRDVELRLYQANKFGTMNFVYGGLLVGDKIEEHVLKPTFAKVHPEAHSKSFKEDGLKRKAQEEDVDSEVPTLKIKRQKRADKQVVEEHGGISLQVGHMAEEKSLCNLNEAMGRKQAPVQAEKSSPAKDGRRDEQPDGNVSKASSTKKRKTSEKRSSPRDEKARLKEEKRARKEERRKRKEEKRRRKANQESVTTDLQKQLGADTGVEERGAESIAGTQVALAPINRHAVRHRYIQQKRLASLNPQALREIFMLQAAS